MSLASIAYSIYETSALQKLWFRPQEQKITEGRTQTDSSGTFRIPVQFNKQATHMLDETTLRIQLTATDLSGEMVEQQMEIPLKNTAFRCNIAGKEQYDCMTAPTVSISFENHAGEPINAKSTAWLVKLQEPKDALRQRSWDKPDSYAYSAKEWKELYPGNEYLEEANIAGQANGDTVKTFHADFGHSTTVQIPSTADPGNYALIVEAYDSLERKSTSETRFMLWASKKTDAGNTELFASFAEEETAEVGSTTTVHIFSSVKHSYLWEVEKNGTILSSGRDICHKRHSTIEIPITKSMQGGISVHVTAASQSRDFSKSFAIDVPFSTKSLTLETSSMRSSIEPGTQESWTVSITEKNGQPVQCELLASMYDASLDAFIPNKWFFSPFQSTYSRLMWSEPQHIEWSRNLYYKPIGNIPHQDPLQLNWFGLKHAPFNVPGWGKRGRGLKSMAMAPTDDVTFATEEIMEESAMPLSTEMQNEAAEEEPVEVRTNFAETAFFYPQINANGSATIAFEVPESLTQWNLQILGHTKDLSFGKLSAIVTSAKSIMVQPNWPRFVYEQDTITISARITNMTDSALDASVFCSFTGDEIKPLSTTNQESKNLLPPRTTKVASWTIAVPSKTKYIAAMIGTKSAQHSDAEQMRIPVIPRRQLVTETLPMYVNGHSTKTYSFASMEKNNDKEMLNYTIEYTSNPVWYALQALPYMAKREHDCSQEYLYKYFAHSIANYLSAKYPQIADVVDRWSENSAETNLERNANLKSSPIEATPWLNDAEAEKQQKQKLQELFNANTNSYEASQAIEALASMQLDSGGWPWFAGGRGNRHITQSILYSFAKLRQYCNIDIPRAINTERAIEYIDKQAIKEYQMHKEKKPTQVNHTAINYLYTRSFYDEYPMELEAKTAHAHFINEAKTGWTKADIRTKAMLAIVFARNGEKSIADDVLRSIAEHAITDDELGTFWKTAHYAYRNYSQTETHTMAIEAFREIKNDTAMVDALKVWLIGNKRTTRWETSMATCEAVFALIASGSHWTQSNAPLQVSLGEKSIEIPDMEPASGYGCKSWHSADISAQMSEITMKNSNSNPAWGAAYIQYFGNVDDIDRHGNSLSIAKQLYIKTSNNHSDAMVAVSKISPIKKGDVVIVRLLIETDRDLEFVHLKDMRAAGLEVLPTTSQYQWKNGIGYYHATGDIAEDFFIDFLPAGKHWFQYRLTAQQTGNFARGTAAIQSMYAPEFSSHSKGERIFIEE